MKKLIMLLLVFVVLLVSCVDDVLVERQSCVFDIYQGGIKIPATKCQSCEQDDYVLDSTFLLNTGELCQ